MLEGEALVTIDWQFNGWGQNTQFKWDDNDAIARQIAEILAVPTERSEIVNEGGGIHLDGQARCSSLTRYSWTQRATRATTETPSPQAFTAR